MEIEEKRMMQVFYVFGGVMLFLIGLRVWLNADLGASSPEYSSTQDKIHKLDIENEALQIKIAERSAYTTIDREARSQGFVDATYYTLK